MRRRDLLAGAASASAVGLGAWTVTSGSLGTGSSVGPDPLVLETIDAPGSEAGEVRVPKPGVVTFIDFFGTWCSPCIEQMAALGRAHDAIKGERVQFLSVTNEPVGETLSREEIARWWADHGGAWTVALDAEDGLTERHDVTRLPTAVVLDPEGTVTWEHTGLVDATRMVKVIRTARSGSESESG